MKTYVFIFLGEFGYEILNWQGCIRKLSRKLTRDKIVCCSRHGLESIYEFADQYIDISGLELYKLSVANGYRGMSPNINCVTHNEAVRNHELNSGIHSLKNISYVCKLHRQIKQYVKEIISGSEYKYKGLRFIFSDSYHIVKGVRFGRTFRESGNIYSKLDYSNNSYHKFEYDQDVYEKVIRDIGLSSSADYVLCQMGTREIVRRSKVELDEKRIIHDISKKVNVIVLNFRTGRNLDSESSFTDFGENVSVYTCGSFIEQSALIGNAKCCVFFTEGDFRSHNYLPPFMGKNVFSVASQSVFDLPTTPIDFWNDHVFRFGGKIIPVVYEQIMSDENEYQNFIETVINTI